MKVPVKNTKSRPSRVLSRKPDLRAASSPSVWKSIARYAAAVGLLLASGCASPLPPRPPFSFAVLADVQYADKDTNIGRHYRASLTNLENCVADLNQRRPFFVIQLGDIIDGQTNLTASCADLDGILGVYRKLRVPAYHVAGNHDFAVGYDTLRERLGLRSFYYAFTHPAAQGWRFVVLDGNDAGYAALGQTQLDWFRNTLAEAARRGERVICFCHYALLKEAAAHHRLAEPEPMLAILDETRCVVAWFAGHDHAGGYAVRNGVHHVTVAGMVEAPAKNAYALIEVYPDRLREIGVGTEPSRELPLPHAGRPLAGALSSPAVASDLPALHPSR